MILLFNIGDYAYDLIKNEKVKILERSEIWGFVSYNVYNLLSHEIYKLNSEQIGQNTDLMYYDEYYVRYMAILGKIKNETSQGILSSLSSGIIPLPHQLHVLNRAVSNNNIRYILADEVGLGKTIEAGLIIKELKARGLVKRILVVCPKGLVTQWEQEMAEKFGEKFHVILPSDYETIRKITGNEDIYGQFQQVISPMDSIKPLESRAGWSKEKIEQYNEDRILAIVNSGWDLVIIDEAHRVAGSTGDVSRHKLGRLLSKSSPYLLLLTATPHSGKTEPFLRLIRLLDEKAFPSYKAIIKEQVAPFVIRNEKREAIDNEGNKLFKNRFTKVVQIHWDERHSMQLKLYEMVTEYVRDGYNKAFKEKKYYIGFLMVLMQRLVTSSTAAIKESIEKRIEILESQRDKISSLSFDDLVEIDLEDKLDEALEVISLDIKEEILQLKAICNLAKQAEYQYLDAKIEALLNILDQIKSETNNPKVIIFTEFVATQSYLSNMLKSRGYTVSLINGSMDIDMRNVALREFKDKNDILISTDAGGEGLNLQFANIVINYDLPWNPMKIEQRIGRVDRIGQKQDVYIYNFIIAETIENRVRTVLEDKLSVILSETGIDKLADVLDNELADVDFSQVYIRSIRSPEDIDYNISKMEEDIRKQVITANEYRELLRENKKLEITSEGFGGFELEKSLYRMLNSYNLWKNGKMILLHNININDEEVIMHLNQDNYWSKEEKIPSITIKDLPNEKGYFSLWELSINDDLQSRKILPIFINDDMIIRPFSGRRIWEEFLKADSIITVDNNITVDSTIMESIFDLAEEAAYDTFLELKAQYEEKNEERYRKYSYALSLRKEAAKRIGIENIRKSRLNSLEAEEKEIALDYERNKNICPVFKPVFMSRME
ncbi:helicase-related protein [Proteiniborus sp.]|uniref:DEAD/DEAH box helicase n=1 Tax=Proteiniborus sp. TaxID=2079015 RepID=UPI003326ECAC